MIAVSPWWVPLLDCSTIILKKTSPGFHEVIHPAAAVVLLLY